ncbi:restriction endonuclease subunit S [Patescibacteria group bacterium]|nr:restriction endonuclease subunit S [Patescibacteria group bacterium]MBU1123732.1 restriction endonuclease subunit S [Patescibacteria group bacterium]
MTHPLPQNWQLLKLEEVANLSSGGTPNRKNGNYWNGDIPWITTSQINSGFISCADEFITEEGLKESSAKLFPKNTLLMAMYGQGKTRGKTAILNIEATTNQACAAIKTKKDQSHKFFFYYLSNEYENIRGMSNDGGQKNLSLGLIKSIKVLVPPSAEQQRIVAILEIWDKAIKKLERKIVLKKNVKKGLMQQLLTGKKQLPGFSGEWEEVRLGDVYDITSSKRVFQSEWTNHGVPFYRAREIVKLNENGHVDNELFISREMFEGYKEKYGAPKKGDILVTGVGTIGIAYLVKEGDEFYFKDGNIVWLKDKGLVSPEFIEQLFNSEIISKQILDATAITTVATYTIDSAKKTRIPLPSSKEQEAIANTLDTANREIELLQSKLLKLKDQKTYLLNHLITGRIRTLSEP